MSPHSAQPRSASPVSPRPPRLGRRMARFNRAVTNKVSIHVAGRLPGLGIVIHVGRRTRTVYRTPVNVFWTKDGFRFALTYGADAEWVRNALAHGAVRLITRGKEYELTNLEVVTDPHRQHVPAIARGLLWMMRVSQFLDMTRAVSATGPAGDVGAGGGAPD
jgi:deazaflavin-dependent oxidoreductase (nitroreductase family)